ncbi:HAD family hydrolase [Listeria costaricensis]|uniref:HAD family hydrolase n=1 Tax=Listeria costaricensis TaxID=2026604 RepID=UPI000C081927|nr:HAD family hydrolase [Listeria costaricensis]
MIKLVITDMDGTFLNSKSEFNRPLYQKVKQLMKEKGVQFAPCTGKQCERVEAIFGEEDTKDLWILGDSATRIKRNGEYVYESLLPNELGQRIIAKLEEIANDYTIIACTPTAAIVKNSTPDEIVNKVVRGSYQNVGFVDEYKEIKEDFVKITIFDLQKRCFATREKLAEFFDEAYIVASEAQWIDISNHGVHKGTTVQELQKMLGVTKAETMVFGDGFNDIELMEQGDYSFAMRNGFDALKEKARYITRSNDEDGVLTTIEQFLR